MFVCVNTKVRKSNLYQVYIKPVYLFLYKNGLSELTFTKPDLKFRNRRINNKNHTHTRHSDSKKIIKMGEDYAKPPTDKLNTAAFMHNTASYQK